MKNLWLIIDRSEQDWMKSVFEGPPVPVRLNVSLYIGRNSSRLLHLLTIGEGLLGNLLLLLLLLLCLFSLVIGFA